MGQGAPVQNWGSKPFAPLSHRRQSQPHLLAEAVPRLTLLCPYFRVNQLIPNIPPTCQTGLFPRSSTGKQRGRAAGLPVEGNTSTVPPKDSPCLKDEQPWMAKQTDGGRKRGARGTGETVVISVISSNHSSTAAFPLLSVCSTHQHTPTAKEDADTCCTLNITTLRKFSLD